MVAFIESLSPWHWFILAVALVVLEVLAPGVIFLWLAIAGLLTGIAVVVEPTLAWETQVLIFSVLSVVSAVAGRIWIKRRPTETDHPELNRRAREWTREWGTGATASRLVASLSPTSTIRARP